MRHMTIVLSLVALAAATGCNKTSESSSGAPAPSTSATTVAPAATSAAPVASATASAAAQPGTTGAKVEIALATVGETMAFDKTALTVPTGAEVHLTLKNNGTTAAMTHNWVLVKPGTEPAVALAGLEKASDAGFVVPSSDVLAYTPLASPKTTVEVTFTAPAAGKYPYICTFPGHYLVMKGVLTVTP